MCAFDEFFDSVKLPRLISCRPYCANTAQTYKFAAPSSSTFARGYPFPAATSNLAPPPMARVIATSLAALALWLAYCLSGVAWRLLRIARHRPETAADAVRFGLLGAAKVAPHGLLYPAAMIESATVVAVGARDPSRARRLASRWGIPRSGDYASVLSDPAVEAVCIPCRNQDLYDWPAPKRLISRGWT